MSSAEVDILLIAIVVSSCCALSGVFLILRRMALMSDAISHAILLGIVLAFFVVKDISSPLLILGAALAGILTVTLTELIIHTKKLKQDAAIGIVFPAFFSLGVILISRYAGDVHLDQDAVLLGEIAFAPFNRFIVNGIDLGPHSLWVMGGILALSIFFIGLFYKELKIATFDKGLATALGFSPILIHYLFMSLVSVTAVGAFDSVGSILVVALMIAPPAAAYLITNRLSHLLAVSVLFGILSGITGFFLADLLDASIAGSMAAMSGIIFLFSLAFAPHRGLISQALRWRYQKRFFASQMLVVQLLDHEGKPEEQTENTVTNMIYHMNWPKRFANQVAAMALSNKWIIRTKNNLTLTGLGREMARSLVLDE